MKFCAVVFLMLILFGDLSSARAKTSPGPLVVLLLPGTSLTDWRRADAPALHRLLGTGAVAVMNTRTARLPNDHTRETPESAVLTLGAGSRAAGGAEATGFYPASAVVPGLSVTYGALYTRRTGITPAPNSRVNPRWPQVVRENSTQGYDLLPGNLGDGLNRHGIAITAGGGQYATALACNSDGGVTALTNGNDLPHPLPPCLVWDAGSDVAMADKIIAEAAAEVRARNGRLIVVSPCVGDAAYVRGERLAPILLWGPNVRAGLLYSSSTHQGGLIANTDFAPSLTAFLGATDMDTWLPVTAFGRSWEFRPSPDALATVSGLEQQAYRQSKGMRTLPVAAVCLGVIALAALFRRRWGGIPGAVTWLPSVMILSLLVSPTPAAAAALLLALGMVYSVLARRWGAWRLNGLTAALTLLVLVGDGLNGNLLMRTGLLGYSAVEGARYYGIGNEAMGVLVGSALVTSALLWPDSRFGRALIGAGLLGLALMLGLPAAGAKAGGLLVAVGSFAAFLWTAWGRLWRGRVLLGIFAVMALGLAFASLGDRLHPRNAQSHMGQAVQRIHGGGPQEAIDIILRKLNVERRLLYHSAWAAPLWVSVFGVLMPLPAHRAEGGRRGKALRLGGGAALLLCLAANDAGAVAASLCGVLVLGGPSSIEVAQKRPAPDAEKRQGTGLIDSAG